MTQMQGANSGGCRGCRPDAISQHCEECQFFLTCEEVERARLRLTRDTLRELIVKWEAVKLVNEADKELEWAAFFREYEVGAQEDGAA